MDKGDKKETLRNSGDNFEILHTVFDTFNTHFLLKIHAFTIHTILARLPIVVAVGRRVLNWQHIFCMHAKFSSKCTWVCVRVSSISNSDGNSLFVFLRSISFRSWECLENKLLFYQDFCASSWIVVVWSFVVADFLLNARVFHITFPRLLCITNLFCYSPKRGQRDNSASEMKTESTCYIDRSTYTHIYLKWTAMNTLPLPRFSGADKKKLPEAILLK